MLTTHLDVNRSSREGCLQLVVLDQGYPVAWQMLKCDMLAVSTTARPRTAVGKLTSVLPGTSFAGVAMAGLPWFGTVRSCRGQRGGPYPTTPVGAVPRSCVPLARFPCPTVPKPHSAQRAQQPQGQAARSLVITLKLSAHHSTVWYCLFQLLGQAF